MTTAQIIAVVIWLAANINDAALADDFAIDCVLQRHRQPWLYR